MPKDSKYLEQWERVNRWLDRLRAIASGREKPLTSEQYRDDIYAFFMNCYHLKDWIKNDPTMKHLKEGIEEFINGSQSLSMCADICNGLKHLALRDSRSGLNPEFGEEMMLIELGNPGSEPSTTIPIKTADGFHDSFTLAEQCVNEWDLYLTFHGEPV
jgi:hypothetical protein